MMTMGFGEVAEHLRRSTVLIHSGARGSGSGVIWSQDGTIVTNAHVVRGDGAKVELWDGRQFEARLQARNGNRDIAVLRVDAGNFPAATLADSSKVRPGELAIAIGNPLGFIGALTSGTIHAVGPFRGIGGRKWIQANLRLAPGNSGGPLADARGRVIGINTMVAGGLALAIPGNAVRDFVSGGLSAESWLGVTVRAVQVPRFAGREKAFGLVVLEVDRGGPADQASLMTGDILLGAEETRFSSVEDLAQVLREGRRVVRFEFLRGDYSQIRKVSVQLRDVLRGKAAA